MMGGLGLVALSGLGITIAATFMIHTFVASGFERAEGQFRTQVAEQALEDVDRLTEALGSAKEAEARWREQATEASRMAIEANNEAEGTEPQACPSNCLLRWP